MGRSFIVENVRFIMSEWPTINSEYELDDEARDEARINIAWKVAEALAERDWQRHKAEARVIVEESLKRRRRR